MVRFDLVDKKLMLTDTDYRKANQPVVTTRDSWLRVLAQTYSNAQSCPACMGSLRTTEPEDVIVTPAAAKELGMDAAVTQYVSMRMLYCRDSCGRRVYRIAHEDKRWYFKSAERGGEY